LLAASNDLPEMFTYEAGAPLGLLIKSGVVLNTEKTLTDMKLIDNVNPGAIDNLKQLSPDGNLYALPLEMNIEGIWYNKKIFTDNNIEIPKTWDDLLKVADTLQAKNIQSFAVAGKEKWPITRYINMLAMRKFGPDVMSQVASGKISATNPDFVQCVKTVQDMAIKGYFGKGVNTIDYSTNTAAFFNGKVAMYYTGSWDLSAFNDPKQNLLGADGMGYFNFPTLAGGVGKSDEYSINCGMILAFAKDKFDTQTSDWFKFLCTKFGDQAMNVDGIMSGFKVNNPPAKVPTYTKLMMDEQTKIKGAGPWFEAKFDSKTSDAAWNNAQMLVIKAITPEEFCKNLDDSIKANITK